MSSDAVGAGAIRRHRQALAAKVPIGEAVEDEIREGKRRRRRYDHAEIQWTEEFGACEIHGAILELYRKLDEKIIGAPRTDELKVNGGGRVSFFEAGPIYWFPETGAHAVLGPAAHCYARHGGARGVLRRPISSTSGTGFSVTGFEGGVIHSTDEVAFEVHGDILAKWNVSRNLGRALSDEIEVPPGIGMDDGPRAYSIFENGNIYWGSRTGAHVVEGKILEHYISEGGPTGRLGNPNSAFDAANKIQSFNGGSIRISGSSGGFASTVEIVEVRVGKVAVIGEIDDGPFDTEVEIEYRVSVRDASGRVLAHRKGKQDGDEVNAAFSTTIASRP